jgi:2-phospho-L-lactate guanylyltransferase (CobY/MobA/RfbA family)
MIMIFQNFSQLRHLFAARVQGLQCHRWVSFLIGCLSCTLVAAQPTGQTVDRIKAAYVFNFAKFVELPVSEEKILKMCVVGRDDLNGAMLSLNRRVAQGREIVVRKDVSVDQAKDCAMVFVGESDARLLPLLVRQLGSASVLLISDARQAMDHGAHLSMVFNDDRVEFDVNLLNLQKSSIRASSQMLKLARVVVR